MNQPAVRAQINALAPKYQVASKNLKSEILNSLQIISGRNRKHLIRCLNRAHLEILKNDRDGRPKKYEFEDLKPYILNLWELMGKISPKRMKAVRLNSSTIHYIKGRISIAYGLFLLQDFDRLKAYAPTLELEEGLHVSSLMQIKTMNLYFQLVLKEDPLFQISPELLENLDQIEKDSTNLENAVEKGLKEQNVEYIKEFEIEQTGYAVDFFVPSKNLIIQADGPWHFLRMSDGSLQPVVQDQIFNEIHEALGYTVLRIPYYQAGTYK